MARAGLHEHDRELDVLHCHVSELSARQNLDIGLRFGADLVQPADAVLVVVGGACLRTFGKSIEEEPEPSGSQLGDAYCARSIRSGSILPVVTSMISMTAFSEPDGDMP